MKHLKDYKIFESNKNLLKTKKEIENKLIQWDIQNYTINDDLSVDVNGEVDLGGILDNFIPIKFNKVNGDFFIPFNNLESLYGCPNEITGDFLCINNDLITLEYGPQIIGGDYICNTNNLNTLKGCPEFISGDFDCKDNLITTLEYCPSKIYDSFDCSFNRITNLNKIPEVGKSFTIHNNPIYALIIFFSHKEDYMQYLKEFIEYDILRGDKVVMNRLKAFINDFDLKQLRMGDISYIRKYYKIV